MNGEEYQNNTIKIIIVIAIIIGVIFFVYKKDIIHIGSQKEISLTSEEKKELKKRQLERSKITIKDEYIYNKDNIQLKSTNIDYNENGYSISINGVNNSPNKFVYNIDYIVVDGYQLDIKINITMEKNEQKNFKINIPNKELDLYMIESIEYIELHGIQSINNDLEDLDLFIETKNNKISGLKDLRRIDNSNRIESNLYKIEEDEGNYYILIDIKNNNDKTPYDIKIKSMKLNGRIIENNDFNLSIKPNCEKIEKIIISKNQTKKITLIELSFFQINNNNIFITAPNSINIKE